MLVIGLTGGIGSGKSTVAQRFEVLGAPLIDTDVIARELVKPERPAYQQVVQLFGDEVLGPDQELNRGLLRKIVFNDAQQRVALEEILHPLVRGKVEKQLSRIDSPYCVVVIPLLFEAGQDDLVDRVLVVDASQEEQLRRSMLRDNADEKIIRAILETQLDRQTRLDKADDIITNDGSLESLYRQVDELHRRYTDMSKISVQEIVVPNNPPVVETKAPETRLQEVNKVRAPYEALAEDLISYSLPLNERLRTFLRLESLFEEAEFHLRSDEVWGTRAAMQGLINIMTVFSRPELKSEFMKELERINAGLVKYAEVEGVDRVRLNDVISHLKQYVKDLRAMDGQIGLSLKMNEFLSAVRQKATMPGGAMCFDTPVYGYWLGKNPQQRKQAIANWLKEFDLIKAIVTIVLKHIRESADPVIETATKGFFQSSLDTSQPYQMIMVKIPADSPYYPEISGGKHRFTVRFFNSNCVDRPVQASEDIKFELICCAL